MKTVFLKLFLISLSFVTSVLYSQEKFSDPNLSLLENIAFNVKSPASAKTLMKNLGYKVSQDSDGGKYVWISFRNSKEDLILINLINKKLSSVSIMLPHKDLEAAKINLAEKNFMSTVEEDGIRYKKNTYPYNIYVTNSGTEGELENLTFYHN